MTNIVRLLATAVLTALLGISGASAQDGPPTFSPFEIIGCNFDDLMPVVDDFNEWADEIGLDGYSAFISVPFFRNGQFPWDFLWMGAFSDGEAMGSGFHQWVNQSGDLQEQFEEVTTCPMRIGLASTTIKAPTGDGDGVEDGGKIITQFTNCTVHEGRTRGEGAGAVREWVDYLTGKGSRSSHWLMVPGPGEATDADYSFKWMTIHSSWVSAGGEFEMALNDGGLGMRGEILGRVMSCDSPRIYNTTFVREAAG